MSAFQAVKLWAMDAVPLARDALHIYVGLLVLLGTAALFRWPLRGWKPWAAVLAVTLLGEAWDIFDRMRLDDGQDYASNWKDVWNTLFWPTALTLLARYTTLLRR